MAYNTSQLWVIYWVHTDPYSFDTGAPDEVYTSQEEAQAACDALNNRPKSFSWERERPWAVGTLYDRIQTIREESRREGELDEQRN
jgi:hypothetical protein